MSRTHAGKGPKRLTRSGGFTLIEVLVAISVIAILGALALPAYQSYVAKARSSELALKYDGVRTNVQVQAKAGTISEQCSAVAAAVNAANLHSEYAAMDVAFEAVPGGFTPVMRFCASSVTQGIQGVDVTREAHHLLSRSATIGKGAIIGDAVVSFSVDLIEGAVVCKVAPLAGKSASGCNVSTAAGAIAPQPQAPTVVPKGPAVVKVDLMTTISGATALSAFSGAQTGVPVGTQLVGLYLAGSDVNQLGGASPGQLPRVSTGYTTVGDSGYQYLDSQGVLARLMPAMVANLKAQAAVGQGNPWDGGIAVFADGTVARMHKVSNGDTSGTEKDYIYFNVLSGVNAQQGMSIVSGTGAPGQSVQVRNGNMVLATVRADAQGNWNFAGAASLAGAGQSLNAALAPSAP
jgi:prepilin-type N-terminal cleavage/methylation domain-containing protein